MTKKEYWYWLCHIDGFGSVRIKKLLEYFESPEDIYLANEREMEKSGILSERLLDAWQRAKKEKDRILNGMETLEKRNILFLTMDDQQYPEKLKQIYDPPFGLYVKGSLTGFSSHSVAIVGARQCTEYGREVARYFGGVLSEAGVSVISGMALGIDAAGHRGHWRKVMRLLQCWHPTWQPVIPETI